MNFELLNTKFENCIKNTWNLLIDLLLRGGDNFFYTLSHAELVKSETNQTFTIDCDDLKMIKTSNFTVFLQSDWSQFVQIQFSVTLALQIPHKRDNFFYTLKIGNFSACMIFFGSKHFCHT